MSTRLRTRSASKPEASATSTNKPKSVKKETPTTSAKENEKTKAVAKSVRSARGKGKGSASKVYCTCKGRDDGTPMVYCVECRDWYHFRCINLSETDAEDINVYVCPDCTEKTGLRSVMVWEGPDAVEEVIEPAAAAAAATVSEPSKPAKEEPVKAERKVPVKDDPPDEQPLSESSDDPGSEDEYIAESKRAKGKRRPRRLSYSSESDLSLESDSARPRKTRRLRKASGSPAPKRKAQNGGHQAPSKKAKVVTDAADDPARKYCLGKFHEVFRDIFLRYPHLHGGEDEGDLTVEKRPEELTDEEKEEILARSDQFATELEQSVYERYSEPDKSGNPHAGPKYKDRFRMLQFNLSKVDRVVLHKRITSGQITPQEISHMSSTDLANEETKQSIKMAEEESLRHSILQKSTAPRAKITHKGLEDIEMNNRDAGERERELEQEERMERERLARVQSAQAQRQRTQSVSVPPESPVVPQEMAWGAPPPVPASAGGGGGEMSPSAVPSRPPLFLATESDMVAGEPELNLADLINIDEEGAPKAEVPESSPVSKSEPSPVDVMMAPPPSSTVPPSPTPLTIPSGSGTSVGMSPFTTGNTPKSETPARSSFDLNTLWSSAPPPSSAEPEASDAANRKEEEEEEERKDVPMIDSETAVADDQDFDMFLEEKETLSTEAIEAAFEATPSVWTGSINMPLDSSVPQDTPVVARQMGGRPIESGSPLWQTLFPSKTVRIDGRVATASSAQFLLQIRMNPTKELIAVAFSPAPDTDRMAFHGISEFLINKDRHGLVFPWGKNPREHHPGREMYIIPLVSSTPLPDYIEMLDDLKLPKIRSTNYMIGIWILNKGKLAPPPPPPPPPVIPTSEVKPANPQSLLDPALLASLLPAGGPAIDQKTIAAEVASLTPEQVQLMLRTLTSGPNPLLPAVASQAVSPQAVPLLPSYQPPMSIPQSWPAPSYGQGPPGPPPPANVDPNPPYSRQQDHLDYRQDSHHDRGRDRDRDRGRAGRSRGRGRGRGGGGDYGPVDSGWNSKRGGGRSSPSRRW